MAFLILLTIFRKQVEIACLLTPSKMLIDIYNVKFELTDLPMFTLATFPPEDEVVVPAKYVMPVTSIIIKGVTILAILCLAYRTLRYRSSVWQALFIYSHF